MRKTAEPMMAPQPPKAAPSPPGTTSPPLAPTSNPNPFRTGGLPGVNITADTNKPNNGNQFSALNKLPGFNTIPSALNTPKATAVPTTPAATGNIAGDWLQSNLSALNKTVGGDINKANYHDNASAAYALAGERTKTVPPLTAMGWTKELGSFQQPADSVLRFIQRAVQDNPQAFAGYTSALASPLVEGALSVGGPAGLIGMGGLYGLLSGGESLAATKAYLDPLLGKLGIS